MAIITMWGMDHMPVVHHLTVIEAKAIDDFSDKVYYALEGFQLAEQRRDDLVRLMVEAAQKFFERGL